MLSPVIPSLLTLQDVVLRSKPLASPSPVPCTPHTCAFRVRTPPGAPALYWAVSSDASSLGVVSIARAAASSIFRLVAGLSPSCSADGVTGAWGRRAAC